MSVAATGLMVLGCKSDPSDPEIASPPRAIGLSTFALQSPSFDCDGFLKLTEQHQQINLSVLAGTFGDETTCLERIAKTGKLNLVQVHLVNETCQRPGGVCYEPVEVFQGLPILYEQLITLGPDFPDSGWLYQRIELLVLDTVMMLDALQVDNCLISPGLESNLSHFAMDLLMIFVRQVSRNRCALVFNPVDDIGPNFEADLYEHHRGSLPTSSAVPIPRVCSNDGTHIRHSNSFTEGYPRNMSIEEAARFVERSEDCEVTFLWAADISNCIIDDDNLEFPTFRNCPPLSRFTDIAELAKP